MCIVVQRSFTPNSMNKRCHHSFLSNILSTVPDFAFDFLHAETAFAGIDESVLLLKMTNEIYGHVSRRKLPTYCY